MEKNHINERGTHTTIIEASRLILEFFYKNRALGIIEVSPGKIEGNVGAKSRSVKFKHINNHVYEMVITHNGSRQEFKVFTEIPKEILLEALRKNKKTADWNINYSDMRDAHKVTE
jgi:hypothetical protein